MNCKQADNLVKQVNERTDLKLYRVKIVNKATGKKSYGVQFEHMPTIYTVYELRVLLKHWGYLIILNSNKEN